MVTTEQEPIADTESKHPPQKITKSQRKRASEEQKNYETVRKQLQSGNGQSITTNNYVKCKWTRFSHQKTACLNGLKKKNPTICCLQRFTSALRIHTDWKGRVKNGYCVQMKTERKLYLDKTDFQTQTILRNIAHYIITKGSIQQEDITFVNIHAPNVGAQK